MPVPKGYMKFGPWWIVNNALQPIESVLPDGFGWKLGKVPSSAELRAERLQAQGAMKKPSGQRRRRGHHGPKCVQGWKLHVGVAAGCAKDLFDAISPKLIEIKAFHKFLPFEDYDRIDYGKEFMKMLDKDSGTPAGKACVIYPQDPDALVRIVRELESLLRSAERQSDDFKPYPGGVKGDIQLGDTGYIYTRYGSFWGEYADKFQIYDPESKKGITDLRFERPFPNFVKGVPDGMQQLKAEAGRLAPTY